MFLASPAVRRQSYMRLASTKPLPSEQDRFAASSPEPNERRMPILLTSPGRRISHVDYSGLSGNEMPSHSDLSDTDTRKPPRVHGASIESLAAQSLPGPASANQDRPASDARNGSQMSGLNIEQVPDRVIWQGWMWLLRSKGGVKQWKDSWAVLRPRNLILYKDESEYTASFILPLGFIVNVVDLDPISRTKKHCMQIITDERSYRFCAHDEESLVQCLGAFKSLLARRRELENKAAAAKAAAASAVASPAPEATASASQERPTPP